MVEQSQIIRRVCGSPDECQRQAVQLAADTFRESLPVRVFYQGPREMLSTVMPIRVLQRLLKTASAVRKAPLAEVAQAVNRPIIPEHVRGIEAYLMKALEENSPYILPPLTLNATGGIDVFVPGGMSPATGWAVLPEEQCLYITDGQHRFHAMLNVIDKLRGSELGSKFMNDGVPVMVTVNSDMSQVHQDFADAAKTKRLPPSLVAAYDLRHPGNRAVVEICGLARVLKNRVDATSSTLSKMSPYLFLANQVRQFVKASISDRPTLGDDAFYTLADNALSNPESFRRWVTSRVMFLDALTALIPDWKVIAELPAPKGPQSDIILNRMKELRAVGSVALTAAGLNALGMVSSAVLTPMMVKGSIPPAQALAERLAPFQTVDWKREAQMWQGNIVQEGRIRTQTTSIKDAARALKHVLGI